VSSTKNSCSPMNYYLEKGAKALQASDLVEPQPGVWSAEAVRLGFMLHNYIRPLGRSVFVGMSGRRVTECVSAGRP